MSASLNEAQSLLDRWNVRFLDWRDHLLASPVFQRRVARFWPTRFIARRRARDLFDLCAGFVYSQVLFTCVRLDVFEMLREGPLSLDTLAARCELPAERMTALLRAAAALGLLEPRGTRGWGLAERGAALLGNPGISAMVTHHSLLYADLADPLALLRDASRDTQLGQFWRYASIDAPNTLGGEAVASYSQLMSATQAFVARDVIATYAFSRHESLLDIGGGEGRFAMAVAQACPRIKVRVFDLPAVAARAQRHVALAGLADRIDTFGGDFHIGRLPRGHDVASLVRVVHDHDDAEALALLRAVRASLPPNGVLVLAEPMAGTAGAQPMGDAYFGMYLLAMKSGRPRTTTELTALLRSAGFNAIKHRPTPQPLLASVLVARVSRLDSSSVNNT